MTFLPPKNPVLDPFFLPTAWMNTRYLTKVEAARPVATWFQKEFQ